MLIVENNGYLTVCLSRNNQQTTIKNRTNITLHYIFYNDM